jgi:hypothetical protein
MDIRLLAATLMAATLGAPATAAPATPGDLPARFVSTWQDLYLAGAPRRVITEETPRNGFFPTVTDDLFNAEGILVSHVSASGRGKQTAADSYRLRLEKGRIMEIAYAPASYGGSIRGGTARPLRYDGDGRVVAMAGDRGLLPTAAALPAGPAVAGTDFVTVIRYEAARQVHDVYVDSAFAYQLEFEFGSDGRLLRSACSKGRCAEAPLIEYGEFGPVFRQEGEVDTRWDYLDGVVASELSRFTSSGAYTDQRYYEAYRFDDCGNWTYREQYNAPASVGTRQQTAVTTRRLEYFQPCRPPRP